MMKKITYYLTICIAVLSFLKTNAQQTTVVVDFETAAKTAAFQYFSSSLEPTTTQIVDNPFKTGINTSTKVSDFKKVVGGQTWAGAFSQSLPIEINVINGGTICVKVLFKQAGGNVTLKLENSSSGGPLWLRTINNTGAVDTWQEFCFDVSLPSLEAPSKPAFGHSYAKAVLFMDFGETTLVDRNYFFDDLVVKSAAATSKNVTFQVDMKGANQPVTNVFVNGSFNNWVPKRLTKNATDSIWKGSFTMPTGNYSYQFTLDSPATRKEVFNAYTTCVKNDTVRREFYRTLTVAKDSTYPAVCYNSCYNCGEGVKITVNLGTSHIAVNPTGIYIAGGGNFGNPGDYPLTGTGAVKSITVERAKGFESFFTFTNGNCPDYGCKEAIAGLSCANPANYNDRKMGPITKDTTINTCFALCTTTTTCGVVDSVNVTFRVDMRRYVPAFTKVYVSGSFNNWAGTGNPLTAPTGTDKIWTTTIKVQKGTDYEFKYQLDNWVAQESFTAVHTPCTILDPSGQYRNRALKSTKDSTLVAYCFGACYDCTRVGVNDVEFTKNLFTVAPSVSDAYFTVSMSDKVQGATQITLTNLLGQNVYQQTVKVAGNQTFNVATKELPVGIYVVGVRVGSTVQTQKVSVSH
jgi:hypothetical protein